MPKITYEEHRFLARSLAMIARANEIIDEYKADDYDLTLRQLYYQLVSRDVIANDQREYSKLGSLVSNARRAGLLDWDAIVDRTRALRGIATYPSAAQAIADAVDGFHLDVWEAQRVYIEVWFEKDALMGVFSRAAGARRVNYFSCRGYSSDSEVWAAARRLRWWATQRLPRGVKARRVVVLHFGDHDPSGIDMTRDVGERLRLFGAPASLRIQRLALNMDQVEQYNPPPNPAKEVDPRFENYQAEFGNESWELDALEPRVLSRLVRSAVDDYIDARAWDASIGEERTARAELRAISENYETVVDRLRDDDAIGNDAENDSVDEMDDDPEA